MDEARAVIASPQNPVVQSIRSLTRRKDRDATGLMLIEGVRLLEEAVLAHVEVVHVLYAHSALSDSRSAGVLAALSGAGARCDLAESRLVDACCDTATPQGIVASARKPQTARQPFQPSAAATPGLVVMVDGVQDPGNLGTLARTALAVGALALVVGEGTTDPFGPKALRASMGSLFRLPVTSCALEGAVHQAQQAGFSVLCADAAATALHYATDLSGAVALIIGNEGAGVSDAIRQLCDGTLRLPMAPAVESLNAAVAGSVLMYEVLRQQQARRQSPGGEPGNE